MVNIARKQGKKNRKYGRNKVKCAKYYNENRRTNNKLRRFKKNNISFNWPESKIKKEIDDFLALQYKRQEKHELVK